VYTYLKSTMFPAYAFPYVAFARVSLSLFEGNPYPAVPRSPRPPSEALKSIVTIFRLAYYAVLHFAILPECHLHATFPLTCINIYSSFSAALREFSEVVTFITFDFLYFKNIKIDTYRLEYNIIQNANDNGRKRYFFQCVMNS